MTVDQVDFNVFAGAETGILKGVNVNKKTVIVKNFHNLQNLQKENEITCMEFGDSAETEILMGLRNQTVKVYDLQSRSFSASISAAAGSGPLVGIARFDDAILTAAQSGHVNWWKCDEKIRFNPIDVEVSNMGKLKKKNVEMTDTDREKHAEHLKIGRKLCKLRQCKYQRNLVATGGKESELQIWDLERLTTVSDDKTEGSSSPVPAPIWRAKNVRPDMLELRVPVWVSDLAFLSHKTVATTSRHGHIRLYDFRSGQRRPHSDLVWEEKGSELSCSSVAPVGEHQVLVGTSTGQLGLWDFRKGAGYRGLIRKYKGCVGAVREISVPHGNPENSYFATVGLDRHLRIYNIKEKKPEFSSYLKSRLNSVLITTDFAPQEEAQKFEPKIKEEVEDQPDFEMDDDEVKIEDDSDIEVVLDDFQDNNESEVGAKKADKKKKKKKEKLRQSQDAKKDDEDDDDAFWEKMIVIDTKPDKEKKTKKKKKKAL